MAKYKHACSLQEAELEDYLKRTSSIQDKGQSIFQRREMNLQGRQRKPTLVKSSFSHYNAIVDNKHLLFSNCYHGNRNVISILDSRF